MADPVLGLMLKPAAVLLALTMPSPVPRQGMAAKRLKG